MFTCKAVSDDAGLATHQAPPDEVVGVGVVVVGVGGVMIGTVVASGGGGLAGIIMGVIVDGGVGLTMGIVSSWVSDTAGENIIGISSLYIFWLCLNASKGFVSAMLGSEEIQNQVFVNVRNQANESRPATHESPSTSLRVAGVLMG